MSSIRVGAFPPLLVGGSSVAGAELTSVPAQAAEAGIDHLCVGDHVSFFIGAGSDGLITATSLLALAPELPVYVALYLLPLRHPIPVARQLSSIAQVAPGRLTLGVGVGGEDRHEVEMCGVDPRTRGRRMDECMHVLRALADDKPVTFEGEFFSFRDALIWPAPSPAIPLIVGGRSNAAITRVGRLGDGWLGIWVSPRRFAAAVEEINEEATSVGRDSSQFEHGINVWCGFGSTSEAARTSIATGMQTFYQTPFESFERYSPYGKPEEVADFLHPYISAGCSVFNLIPCASDDETAMAGVGEVRRLLS